MFPKRKPPADPLAALGLDDAQQRALEAWIGSAPKAIDAVWEFVGRDPDAGCNPPSGSALDRATLLKALLAVAKLERQERTRASGWAGVRVFLRHHLLEIGAAVLLLVIAAGALRVKAVQHHWTSGLGLMTTVIALHDLERGREIASGDLVTTYLPTATGAVQDPARVVGRRPSGAISIGRRVVQAALQIRQVVAEVALEPGTPVTPTAVAESWTTELPLSVRSLADAIGRCVVRHVPPGEILTNDNLQRCP